MRPAVIALVTIGLCAAVPAPAASPDGADAPSPRASSAYVAMQDGTQLAIDTWLPGAGSSAGPWPAVVQFTRYWRAFRSTGRPTSPEGEAIVDFFTAAGYAVVIVDVRGTGASFGARSTEFSDAEVRDYGDTIDWIASQPWSNGRVATLGSSYLGNAAELAAIPARPALRAVVPRFSDFSEYRHAIRPGGVKNAVIADAWIAFTHALDRNDGCAAFATGPPCDPAAPWAAGVRPVDADPDGKWLAAAIAAHRGNADLKRIVAHLTYSDDSFAQGGDPTVTLDAVSPSGRWRQIDRAAVPGFHWASWFDGGTAAGVLTRFLNYRTPLQIVIGAWTHGGGAEADPYRSGRDALAPTPTATMQLEMIRAFLDPLLRSDAAAAIPSRRTGSIRYVTLGTNAWHDTDVWPPRGVSNQRWYFQAEHALAAARVGTAEGTDAYTVDFSASTGPRNRWHTQLGTAVRYGDVSDADRRRLTYTSSPLTDDIEVTGTPVAEVVLATTAGDGAVFVYLEDVDPTGRVTYLTEGQLRLLFPASVGDPPPYVSAGPLPDFGRTAAKAPSPGEFRHYRIALNPISVVVKRGHRLRVSIAGADADTFERLPATGNPPTLRIRHGGDDSSFVVLPVRGPVRR